MIQTEQLSPAFRKWWDSPARRGHAYEIPDGIMDVAAIVFAAGVEHQRISYLAQIAADVKELHKTSKQAFKDIESALDELVDTDFS